MAVPKFQSYVAKQVPHGTLSVTRFATMYCVTAYMIEKHICIGIAGERIEVTEATLRRHVRRYLTPEQQQKALEFWDRHGIQYQRIREI